MQSNLSPQGGAPPAPNPQPAAPSPPVGGPLAPAGSAGAQGGGPGGLQNLPPPPSAAQTIIGLRHFVAIEKEVTSILNDPDCGRADVRSKVQDGAIGLVARGIITPAQAVAQMADFPTKPFDQKRWLEKHLVDAANSQTILLAHHQMGGPNQNSTPPDFDNHQAIMAGLAQQYQGAK